EHRIRVGFWIHDDKTYFDELLNHKNEIELAAGFSLDWDRLDGKKASIICTSISGLDFNNPDNYPELIEKVIDIVIAEKKAFSPYIK
ncbi:MAG: DUF4268 domain-containing protein, partial [Firmicutes bacterium]|nr:DUF4268 domain-containing protein [Bacillota bacterium]